MEANSSHSKATVTNSDCAVSQLAARMVSEYLQTEGCKKSQELFHVESPIKSLFTHSSCAQCTPPSSLTQLLKDYYRMKAIVNDKSAIQTPAIPQCKTSLQLVRASTSRKKKGTRVDQLACIPLDYKSNGAHSDGVCSSGPGIEGKMVSLSSQVERHEKTIKNLVQCVNMQQKTLQTLVINSLGGQKKQVGSSPSRKRKNESPQLHSTKKRSVTAAAESDVSENVDVERGEHMTQLIDTILNDQSLLDKLVNYINQSIEQPTDSDASVVEEQSFIENIRTSDVAENVIRLTESDPQFESLMDKWK